MLGDFAKKTISIPLKALGYFFFHPSASRKSLEIVKSPKDSEILITEGELSMIISHNIGKTTIGMYLSLIPSAPLAYSLENPYLIIPGLVSNILSGAYQTFKDFREYKLTKE
jgi:hypothetical protein